MPARREMVLNAFTMNCVGHINHGLWTHPRDRSADYTRLDHWTALARTLERGLFDAVFIADIVGVYDVYDGGIDLTARESIQLPVNEPTLLVPAMAAVTKDLGFGVTVNIAGEHPYTFARRLSTLDHLTGGRVGWNVVTGYLDSAARAVGEDGLAQHDSRYDRADDYLDLLYKLLEGSWDDDAVRRDRAARVYADPAKIRRVRHEGPFYRSEGYHLAEPSPQRTPVLFQAGASGRGQRFAARHAECVFISAPDKETARRTARALRAEVVAAGPEAGLAHFAAGSGVDLSRYGLDDEISYGTGNAIQSTTQVAKSRGFTKRQLLEQVALGGRYPLVVGDGAEVARELEAWMEEGEVDGFNLTRTVVPECWDDFVRIAVPALQERGLHKRDYRGGTLRAKLFGRGDRLGGAHAGARQSLA